MPRFFAPLYSLLLAVILCGAVSSAYADSSTSVPMSGRALQEALGTDDGFSLYDGKRKTGFGFAGGFFSGRASGVETDFRDSMSQSLSGDVGAAPGAAELEGDQRVYALLVDGRYDFNYDRADGMGLHPYLAGGMGVARYGQPAGFGGGYLAQDGDMVPLFRVGGGVTYRLGQQWNLSLDYKAGFTGTANDQLFTVRNQQAVDLQTLNMGMHYKF